MRTLYTSRTKKRGFYDSARSEATGDPAQRTHGTRQGKTVGGRDAGRRAVTGLITEQRTPCHEMAHYTAELPLKAMNDASGACFMNVHIRTPPRPLPSLPAPAGSEAPSQLLPRNGEKMPRSQINNKPHDSPTRGPAAPHGSHSLSAATPALSSLGPAVQVPRDSRAGPGSS
ncbi:hypothetical protein E2C01_032252 [Portunus trituberculatus]|uniref:Uncharacterized protein n=1 Tax=Portunus trituberculatus TaxID=210409 RepID=A0A5B7F0E6_PORTR|nr:hypothetical protein [Portunus trituberculatus]